MVPLGMKAPDFALPDPSGRIFSLRDFVDARMLLVVFACNHCPYVKHVSRGLARLAVDLTDVGVVTVAINSNDSTRYPQDAPPEMTRFAASSGWRFPYVYDESQAAARAFGAECTPDFFLFDEERRLVYRGQMDDSRPGNDQAVTGEAIRTAVSNHLAGEPPLPTQSASMGCSIKWRHDA
jgi:peroxiredoxin